MNARQQELLENYKELLCKALREAYQKNPENPYEATWFKEIFLTDYGLFRGVGEYARKRYYEEFTKQGIFTNQPEEKFKLGYPEEVLNAIYRFNLNMPSDMKTAFKPKPETEEQKTAQ